MRGLAFQWRWAERLTLFGLLLALLVFVLLPDFAHAHGMEDEDKAFVEGVAGINLLPFMYLGAKHMVTGYDHLLFLAGVIFFLFKLRDIATYVTLFAIGHSLTLLFGVIFNLQANAYLVDAIIGLSVVYKALDNLGAFDTLLGWRPNPKGAVLIFGFFHGFGLATKLQELTMAQDGMIPNLLAFNVGVELGQFMALAVILIAMNFWRLSPSFSRHATFANAGLMSAGLVLIGFQLAGFFVDRSMT